MRKVKDIADVSKGDRLTVAEDYYCLKVGKTYIVAGIIASTVHFVSHDGCDRDMPCTPKVCGGFNVNILYWADDTEDTPVSLNGQHKCTCEIATLMKSGCGCGGV